MSPALRRHDDFPYNPANLPGTLVSAQPYSLLTWALFRRLFKRIGLDGRPLRGLGLPGNKGTDAGDYEHVGYRRA
jgi:hypothetical protein